MSPMVKQFLAAVMFMGGFLCWPATSAMASASGTVRLGYLDHPGSALCRIAEANGHFREEGLLVELVRFADSGSGLAALESGSIDVGAFRADDTLRAIADGKGFRIIAGGGTQQAVNPLAELDEALQVETDSKGIVVLIPGTWPNAEKGIIIQLTAALIRAYRTRQQDAHHDGKPGEVVHFDPNPDYWRLERIWRSLGLQGVAMKRDFLASHVYEEIYCDALDRMLLGPIDSVLQSLFSKAVCTPNCCPASAAKL